MKNARVVAILRLQVRKCISAHDTIEDSKHIQFDKLHVIPHYFYGKYVLQCAYII